MKQMIKILDGLVCDTCNYVAKSDTNEFDLFVEVKNRTIEIDLCKNCFDRFIKSNLKQRKDSSPDEVSLDELLGIKKVN